MSDEDRRRLAIHEAAHALVAIVLGLDVTLVTIELSDSSLREWSNGHVLLDLFSLRDAEPATLAAVCVAGATALILLRIEPADMGGFGSDFGAIAKLAKREGVDAKTFRDAATAKAVAVLTKHADALQRIADRLLQEKTLAGDDIASLLKS